MGDIKNARVSRVLMGPQTLILLACTFQKFSLPPPSSRAGSATGMNCLLKHHKYPRIDSRDSKFKACERGKQKEKMHSTRIY